MTNEIFHGEYFEWLRSQIHVPDGELYFSVIHLLHNREFVWTVPNDDNRVADGLALRTEWANGSTGSDLPLRQGVSILEVLIALSRHMEFQAGGQACYWAWRFIENLGLHRYPDGVANRRTRRHDVEDILDRFVWRQYDRDGTGGLFPLAWPKEDQTKIEIWYQMHAYLNEMQEP